MANLDPHRVTELRVLISDFIKKRLEDKLDKLKDDDPKRVELQAQFIPAVWLEDAAKRVSQIQAVTHSLKPIHPDAKGTSLYRPPHAQSALTVVGSHCLGAAFARDVVGNAAALDVYKFLKLEHQGSSLLNLVLESDADLAAALSDDPAQSQGWISAFAKLIEPRGRVTSHTLAKQMYWLTDTDAHSDASYQLLAPLYGSSLAHHVHEVVQNDRFGDESVIARKAKKAGEYSERPVREYPQLAIQNLGGTKPQNISQLNFERRGDNLLLASLPPNWRSIELKPLTGAASMFSRFFWRSGVRPMVSDLLKFLSAESRNNAGTRARRDELVNDLIDEFFQFSAELRSLPLGWSQTSECLLTNAEKHWLDPEGVEQALESEDLPLPNDTQERVSALFANWLNAKLRDPLPMGDPEFLQWRNQMYEQIKTEEREAQS